MSYSIEHWRDGEKIANFDLTTMKVEWRDGIARIVFPPGTITLATDDELRFNPQELINFLQQL